MSTKDIDAATILAWARVVDDHNPLHIDPEYAATTRFGGPIAHGSLLFALVSDALQASGHGGTVTVKFRAPVPVGSTITLAVTGEDVRMRCGDTEPVEVRTSEGEHEL
jgi:acyl dehydratase